MMWNVQTVVEREVRADSREEAVAIAESLVLAMPHLNTRVCPTDPDVYSQADELEETGTSRALERVRAERAAAAFAEALSGQPYKAPGYNAPIETEEAVTAPLRVEDPDEPHPDVVDLPPMEIVDRTELDAKAAMHAEPVLDADDACTACGEHFSDPHAPGCPRDVEPEGTDD